MKSHKTYYEILNVPRDVNTKAIRQAYLRLSLKHHPDKNPNNVEEAKARFIEIGQAHETLIDPQLRAAYDREISGNRLRGAAASAVPSPSCFATNDYDNYRDAFDDCVSGMSEEDLAGAMGAAAMVGGFVGSMVGSRMASSGSKGGGAGVGVLSTVGSMVGSMMASQAASSAVKSLHQQSQERVAYRDACRDAVARGKPVPPEPQAKESQWGNMLNKAVDLMKDDFASNSQPRPDNQDYQSHQQQQNRGGSSWNDVLNMAKDFINEPSPQTQQHQQQQQQQTTGEATSWKKAIEAAMNAAMANNKDTKR